MYYYIGTNRVDKSGYTNVMINAQQGWKVQGYTGQYWHERVKASEVTEYEDLLKFTTYHDAEDWLMAEGGAFGDEVIAVKEGKDMNKKFYIKSANTGAIIRYQDNNHGWRLKGVAGFIYADQIKPTDPRVVMFDTREEAQAVIDSHRNKTWEFEVVEFKEEDMKLYSIAMKLLRGGGGYVLVSVIDNENPLHTSVGDAAVVSSKPEKLEHLRDTLPEESFAKIVEVTMGDDGKWVIGKDWKPEPVLKRYLYKLKGVEEATYIKVAENGVVNLTTIRLDATPMTHEEAMDLASKRGLRLTAFEKIEVE